MRKLRLRDEAWGQASRPKPRLLISEWADEFRVMPPGAPVPGPWRTSLTPYMKEPMDALSAESGVNMVVMQKAAQIGGTEIANNLIGYVMHHAPGHILLVMPTLDSVKKASRRRIDALFAAYGAKGAKARETDTVLEKSFDGGMLTMIGAKSPSGLKNISVPIVIMDELDEYEDDLDGQGSVVEMAMARTTTFHSRKKILMLSTPTEKGLSNIEHWLQKTDQRVYECPCPECGNYKDFEFGDLVFDKALPFDQRKVTMACHQCGASIEEGQKTEMLARGRWRATAESANATVRGYRINGLYSPLGWLSWAQVVEEFLDAHRENKERGDSDDLRSWIQLRMAMPYDPLKGGAVSPEKLLNAREDWRAFPVKPDYVTVGADVQQDRIEATVIGWMENEESYVIDHAVFKGATVEEACWKAFDDYLDTKFPVKDGEPVGVDMALCDAGFQTGEVYKWQEEIGFAPCRGAQSQWAPAVVEKGGTDGRSYLQVGQAEIKEILQKHLALKEGAGRCHFPRAKWCDREYFAQLLSEELQLKQRFKRGWRKVRDRNEALDCWVYAYAGLKYLKLTSEPEPAQTSEWQMLSEGL